MLKMFVLLVCMGLVGGLTAAETTVPAVAAQTNLPTVVCLGDSITRAGYPQELEKILPVRVVNAGVNGNNSRQGLARLEKDVLRHKPKAVLILFGTNDNRQDSTRAHVPLPEYEQNLIQIIDRCQQAGAKILLGTIPPIDPEPYFTRHDKPKFDAIGGLDKLVSDYRNTAIKVAKSKKIKVVDLNKLLAKEPAWRSADGVHPTVEGNQIIARCFAKELKPLLNLKVAQ